MLKSPFIDPPGFSLNVAVPSTPQRSHRCRGMPLRFDGNIAIHGRPGLSGPGGLAAAPGVRGGPLRNDGTFVDRNPCIVFMDPGSREEK